MSRPRPPFRAAHDELSIVWSRGSNQTLLASWPAHPYNVPIDGHVCGLGRIRHREFAMGVGETSSLEFRTFLEHTLGPAADRCRDGAIAFVCMDWRHAEELITAGKNVFAELKNLCVWNKTNAGMRMKGDSVS
jgi:hypothetical protein